MGPFSLKPPGKDDATSAERTALLAAIVDCASEAIIAMDLRGDVLSWNTAATRLYGHNARDMIGQQMSRIIPHNRHHQLEALLIHTGNGDNFEGLETVHCTATGREIAVTMAASPVRDRHGHVIAMAAFVRPHNHSRTIRTAASPIPGAAIPQATERTILIVEDEPLIGLGLALILENMGFDVIGPVATLTAAMTMLDNHPCSLAIIDAHLARGETSAPLAQRLKRDGIPFLALYGNAADTRPAIFHEVRNFPKPLNARALVAAVHDVLG